jgi:hypothetical protein
MTAFFLCVGGVGIGVVVRVGCGERLVKIDEVGIIFF